MVDPATHGHVGHDPFGSAHWGRPAIHLLIDLAVWTAAGF
jgi:hypothetical protein